MLHQSDESTSAQWRLKLPSFKLSGVTIALALALLAFGAAIAVASVHTYFGTGTQTYGVGYESDWSDKSWNRAYRPLYYYETIMYTDDSTGWGYKRNYDENPIVQPDDGGVSRAYCAYSDGDIQGTLDNVTCQYGE